VRTKFDIFVFLLVSLGGYLNWWTITPRGYQCWHV